MRAAISLARGHREQGLRDQLRALELARAKHDPSARLGTLIGTAATYAEIGHFDEAHRLAVQVPPLVREIGGHGALTWLALFAETLGIRDDLREALAAGAGPSMPRWRTVIEHILVGELDAAANIMNSAGNPTIEANIRKHAGLRMLAAGRTADAKVELERALTFYRSVDASARVAEIESALAGDQRDSA